MSSVIWQKAPKKLDLGLNEVHIWKAALTQWSDLPADVLSPEELRRSARFLREEHQRQFALARAFLRLILAVYLPINPAQIRFREGAYGKLYLVDNPIQLEFNLSHSKDLALYALTLGQEIGIDVEWMDPHLTVEPLVTRFFSSAEQRAILTLPEDQQIDAFYDHWTCKEAYLKALGLGLSGLSSSISHYQKGAIISLEPAPEYVGALAFTPDGNLSSMQKKYYQIGSF